MKRSGRSVEAASRVIEIDEVLEATMASGLSTAQRSWKILRLTSSFSTALSITRSQSASPSMASAATMCASACLRASSVMTFLETWRARLPLMVAMPDFRRSAETSLSTTSKPARAATCAMPLPIWPEPITPTFLIIAILSSHRRVPAPALLLHKHRMVSAHPAAAITFRASPAPRSVREPPDRDPRPGRNRPPGKSARPRPC